MLSPEQLRPYPLCAGLSDSELAELAACATKRAFAKGAYLFHAGNPVVSLYLVEEGLVRHFYTTAHGEECLANVIGPRGVIGLPLLRKNQTRTLGAAALLPTVVLALPVTDLSRVVERSPRLMYNLFDYVNGLAGKMALQIQALSTLSISGRLATALLVCSRDDRQQISNAVDLPLSQADWAIWVGASRGALNRAVARLKHLGLIRMEGHKFILLDRPGLQRLSEELLPDQE